MNENKYENQLDEMQLQKRNKIGNQSFLLLCWLIILDACLYGLGIRWLEYPVNTFCLMLIACAYYVIRTIWAGAFKGVSTDKNKNASKKIISQIIFTALSAFLTVLIVKSNLIKVKATPSQDNGAKVLFMLSVAVLVIGVIVTIVYNKKNNSDDE